MRMARIYSKCSKCGQMGYIGSGTDCVKCENPVPTDADRITQLERDLSEARRERDEARAQLDTYIRTAADAVAEQGRLERALAAAREQATPPKGCVLTDDGTVRKVRSADTNTNGPIYGTALLNGETVMVLAAAESARATP